MTKNKLMLGALLALSILMPVQPRAAEVANGSPSPSGFGGVVDSLNYQGVKPIRIPSSTSAQLLRAGAGFVDAVCPYLGTAGNYTMLYDAAAAGDGPAIAANGLTSTTALTYAITPQVFTAGGTVATATGQYSLLAGQGGCWFPPAPIKFVNGLYSMANATGHATIVYGHCSNGTNPCVFP